MKKKNGKMTTDELSAHVDKMFKMENDAHDARLKRFEELTSSAGPDGMSVDAQNELRQLARDHAALVPFSSTKHTR